jgi:hypothetical protein
MVNIGLCDSKPFSLIQDSFEIDFDPATDLEPLPVKEIEAESHSTDEYQQLKIRHQRLIQARDRLLLIQKLENIKSQARDLQRSLNGRVKHPKHNFQSVLKRILV